MEVCPVFIDETGILSGVSQEQPVFGVGVLVIPEPKAITDSLYRLHFNFSSERMSRRQALRRRIKAGEEQPSLDELDKLMHSTRHHEYKFSEITRFNIQQYVDLLNLYFQYTDVQFHALILDRLDSSHSISRWDGDVWLAYAELTRDLLEQCLDRDVFAIVDLQGKPDTSPVYLEDTLCSVGNVKGCLRATSDMSIYLQLVDLLLGCVQFDWKDAQGFYDADSRRAGEKRQLASFVKRRLGLPLHERMLRGEDDIREWRAQSLFTVRRAPL